LLSLEGAEKISALKGEGRTVLMDGYLFDRFGWFAADQ
jgi:hypothetical protein